MVEEVEDYFKQVSLEDAQKLQPGAVLGDYIVDPLPPIEFGRIAAQAAKQVIFQKVRDAERERQYEEFKERAGEIITGVVKRVEFGHVVVDLGRAEGVIRRDQQIPREILRVGDRTRSLISNVRRENRGPQIFLSPRPSRFHAASCSPRKCPRFTTASSRSRPPPAIRAAAPRSASSPTTARSTRSAPASA